METTDNPLVVISKTSEQSVQLHPLVLLTISDYVTRHVVRQQQGPIVGAILGTQDGQTTTLEHAFECKLDTEQKDMTLLDASWFSDRLQQFRDVHKAANLDLVGWFTLAPTSGPQPEHLPIHRQLAEAYNESLLLLAFHPTAISQDASKSDKLPVTVYEPILEAGADDADKQMQEPRESPSTALRFKELTYRIESGDAEMIGVDFVARGGANATAVQSTPVQNGAKTTSASDKGKGKVKAAAHDEIRTSDLTAEEEDLIASMTGKANAIRMLRQRVNLLKNYLLSLPPCYLNDPSITTCEPHEQISHPILRSIAALLARLPLLIPYTPTAELPTSTQAPTSAAPTSVYGQESAEQATDVAMASLLGTLGSTLQTAFNMGEKLVTVERDQKSRPGEGDFTRFDSNPFDSQELDVY